MSPSQILAFDVGLKNFAYCLARTDGEIRQLRVVDLGARKGNTQAVMDAVIEVLDSIAFTELDLEVPLLVLIEQQMTSIMKCVQTVIHAFFKMASRYHGLEVTTRTFSARHKLALMSRYPDYQPSERAQAAPTQYQKNKMDSIHFATWLLTEKTKDEATLQKLQAYKKKDDAADAYLMVMCQL